MNRSRPWLLFALLGSSACAEVPVTGDIQDDTPSRSATAEGARGVARVRTRWGEKLMHYKVRNGLAIAQGDINLGPIRDIIGRGGATHADLLWPNGKVRYAFDDDFAPGVCSDSFIDDDCVCNDDLGGPIDCTSARDVIREVMDELELILPISIEEVDPDDGGDMIVISYEEDADFGGHSKVGFQGGSQALRFNDPGKDEASDQPKRDTARHEIVHALGMWHEHERTDRDQFVVYDDTCVAWENEDEFEKETDSIDLGPYDFVSIMHYRHTTYCINEDGAPGCDCFPLAKLNPVLPGDADLHALHGEVLSEEDINTLHHMYADSGGTNNTDDAFGNALAIADFDRDGYDDVAVGIPGEDLTHTNQGMVVLYKGTATGFVTWHTITEDTLAAAPANGEKFGSALTAGHFDTDGFLDLAIGAPGEVDGGIPAGAVFVLRGDGHDFSLMWTLTQGAVFGEGSFPGDQFGAALAVGDLAGVNRHAVIVGAPGNKTTFAGPTTGSVFAFQFNEDGTMLYKPTRISAGASGDQFGASLEVGSMAGNSRRDVAVGAPSTGGVGRVYLLSGRTPPESNPLLWSQMLEMKTLIDGTGTGARFGTSIAFDDMLFGNATKPDLAIGSPGFSGGAGRVDVFDVNDDFTTVPAQTIRISPPLGGANLGFALASGPLDDTTFANDLAIGEPGRLGGRVQIALGGTVGPTLVTHQQFDLFVDDDAGDRYGAALAVGQINGWTGIDDVDDKLSASRHLDLVVGAPGEAPDFFFMEDPAGSGAIFALLGNTGVSLTPWRSWNQETSGGL
jgi:hypothetical protein